MPSNVNHVQTDAVLERSGLARSGEWVLARGAVSSKYMNARIAERRRGPASKKQLKAQFVATERTFFYVAYNVELVWAHPWESVTSLEVTHKSKGVAGPGMFMGGGRPEFVDLEMVVDGQTIDLTLGNYGLFGAAGGIDQQELLAAFKNAKRQF